MLELKKRAIAVGILMLAAYGIIFLPMASSDVLWLFLEAGSGFAVMAIPFLMQPLFWKYGKRLVILYVILKIIEGLMIVAGSILHLFRMSVLRYSLYLVHPFVFMIGALLFYILLFRSNLVPRLFPIWGYFALACLFIQNMFEVSGYNVFMGGILFLPIFANEIILSLWLIIKGFEVEK